ncbi:MAG: glycosyltransferase [Bacteroidales bacterium]|nr:glycosyltransferase [Bacteroidales bacterium]
MAVLSNKNYKILYLTYDGLTDPLGQSQILPYLEGLSSKGISFYVISFEKKQAYSQLKHYIKKRCDEQSIIWIPIIYHKNPPILSTLWDLFSLYFRAISLHKKNKFQIIHCRSYITSIIGLHMQKRYNVKFVFDMRGFWADERIDRNIWNKSNALYRIIYHFFKKKEVLLLNKANAIIVLTKASKKYIESRFKIDSSKITIIPCATEFNKQSSYIPELPDNSFKLIYVGSFRTAYLTDEMFLFFSILLQKYSNALFVILTNESNEYFYPWLLKYNISSDNIFVKKVNHSDVYSYLLHADLGICFIKPAFSSIASSPTKFAEMLAANLPVVCNDIGDLKEHCKQIPYTHCFSELNETTFKEFIMKFTQPSSEERKKISDSARNIYDLHDAIEQYLNVYSQWYE